MSRCVVFLSDYGYGDPFVGTCHAVIKRVSPAIQIVDLTHAVAAQDVRGGAIALSDAAPFLPGRAVVLAVVDPGVGSHRRGVAVDTAGGLTFVGPDNGLLAPAIAAAGGATVVSELSNSPWRIEPVSNTFHGRDVFAPVSARIAAGAATGDAGQPLDPSVLLSLELQRPTQIAGGVRAEISNIDHFGNVRLAARAKDLSESGIEVGSEIEIETGRGMRTPAQFVATYSDVPEHEPLLFIDANGAAAIAVNGGSAAAELKVMRGSSVQILQAGSA
ncbi:MAG: SAM-dependent chlorinase/fluorinase [Solirubrobacterales bacterium]